MAAITKEYVDNLPQIYKDILAAFPEIDPARNAGEGLAYQTLFEQLRQSPEEEHLADYIDAARKRAWSLREVIEACRNMEQGGAVRIDHEIFICPTPMGEEIIALLTGKKAAEHHVDPFPTPAEG